MLKIWLPLITDTRNQGTQQSIATNSGATVSTTGPLGGSYSFDGTNDQIQTTYTSAEAEMSVCMWVNFSGFNVHLLDMRNSSGVGYQPAYVASNGVQVGGTSNSQFPYINYSFSTGIWYHLAIVYSSTQTELYVNGTSVGTASTSVGYNYNMSMEVHLGSRYSGANWFSGNVSDFRIYNHALNPGEVKIISQGLLLHYTRPNETLNVGAYVNDNSGYNRNGLVNTAQITRAGGPNFRYYYGFNTSTGGGYISTASPSSMTKTISFWLSTPKTASTVFFADYKSKMAFGFNGSGYIIATCDSWSKPMFTNTSAISSSGLNHIVIRHNSSDDGVELFIDGVQQTASGSNNYWTHSTDTLMIGQRSSGTPMANAIFSDFRMFAKRLSNDEITDLYHTSLKQLKNGRSVPYELIEDTVGRVKVYKSGILKNNEFVESTVGNKFKATQVISNEFIER